MEITHITKKLAKNQVITDVTFHMERGEIVGLIGRNGTGKTSLFRILSGQYTPDTGSIKMDQTCLSSEPLLKEKIFYLDKQYHYLKNQTPIEIGAIYSLLYSKFDQEKYNSLLEKYRLPLREKYFTYSKGMQGLLDIIVAVSSNADYLFLDEPFDGLDILIKKQIIQLLLNEVAHLNCSILISSHNLSELEMIIDRALIIKDGHLTKDYKIETSRSKIKKIQMVFKKNKLPIFLKNECKVLQIRGRVIVALFPDLTVELKEKIAAENFVLFEELPLSLEDLFIAELTEDADFSAYN